jgi:hypothetical protein
MLLFPMIAAAVQNHPRVASWKVLVAASSFVVVEDIIIGSDWKNILL